MRLLQTLYERYFWWRVRQSEKDDDDYVVVDVDGKLDKPIVLERGDGIVLEYRGTLEEYDGQRPVRVRKIKRPNAARRFLRRLALRSLGFR